MARTETALISITDDVTGLTFTAPADTPQYVVSFGADNEDAETFTLDLHSDVADAFRQLLTGNSAPMRAVLSGRGNGTAPMVSLAKEARVWAKAQTVTKNGKTVARWTIGDQGKLPDEVMGAYKASLRTVPADDSPAGHSTK